VSHAEKLVTVALSTAAPVGVDIEWVGRDIPVEELAAAALTATEQDAIRRSGDPTGAFLAAWTRKEAVAKALGLGLELKPSAIDVSRPIAVTTGTLPQHRAGLWDLQMPRGYVGSAAILAPIRGVVVRNASPLLAQWFRHVERA
jgi:4'-phosphopantetheinyl transferase